MSSGLSFVRARIECANLRFVEVQLLRNLENGNLLLATRRREALTGQRPLGLLAIFRSPFCTLLFGLVVHLG